MTREEKIIKIIKNNNGYVTRKDIDKENIPSIYLSRYVKKHSLTLVARGFYAIQDWIIDPYLVFQYTYPNFIFSFNSAIYLHGLGDNLPNYLEVTKPINYHPYTKRREDVIVHTDTVSSSYNLGIIEAITPLGNKVRV